ncbi:MAG TPA: SprT-like domain-containing protein [Candidatus Angelobacter sp.]|nr:SprT-like domain-containing protein [Candidatus Angelobacter sp.]
MASRYQMTNKDLKKLFLHLNERFYQNRIPKSYHLRFDDLEEGTQGECSVEDEEILIDNRFRKDIDFVTIILHHEMTHADNPEYIGNIDDETHGTMFQGGIARLIRMGAYDGLL